jgi:hypothetical protein
LWGSRQEEHVPLLNTKVEVKVALATRRKYVIIARSQCIAKGTASSGRCTSHKKSSQCYG